MITLQLIGIKGAYKYEIWRNRTLLAMKDLGLNSSLMEVNNIETIIDFKVGAIPALMMDNNLIIEHTHHIPETHEIKNCILSAIK